MGIKKKSVSKVNSLIELKYEKTKDSNRRVLDVRDIVTFKIMDGELTICIKNRKNEIQIQNNSYKVYEKIKEIKEKLLQEQLNERSAKITSI